MAKVLFHSPALNFRGVTNSILDYAVFNQTILGNESAIVYNPKFKLYPDFETGSRLPVVFYLKRFFQVHEYTTEEELNRIAEKYDLVYTQCAGNKAPPYITSTKSAIHAVFQYNEPYGDKYAYISKWLSNHMSGGSIPYVPLIVDMPRHEEKEREIRNQMRKSLGISAKDFMIGRLGGYLTFDIEYVHETIKKIVNNPKNKRIKFVLANTEEFHKHPNIIHVNPFFGKPAKAGFILACDAMIHARKLGESFGLSICEGLFYNKPVLASETGYDLNHLELLKNTELLYNEETLEKKILNLPSVVEQNYYYDTIVEPFSGANVMPTFTNIFLG